MTEWNDDLIPIAGPKFIINAVQTYGITVDKIRVEKDGSVCKVVLEEDLDGKHPQLAFVDGQSTGGSDFGPDRLRTAKLVASPITTFNATASAYSGDISLTGPAQ